MPAVFPHLSDNPGAVRERAPTLGEHTDAVLASAGLSQEQRDALRARGDRVKGGRGERAL